MTLYCKFWGHQIIHYACRTFLRVVVSLNRNVIRLNLPVIFMNKTITLLDDLRLFIILIVELSSIRGRFIDGYSTIFIIPRTLPVSMSYLTPGLSSSFQLYQNIYFSYMGILLSLIYTILLKIILFFDRFLFVRVGFKTANQCNV